MKTSTMKVQKKSRLKTRGVLRVALTIPADQEHLLKLSGLTEDSSGTGPVGFMRTVSDDGKSVHISGYRGNAFVNQGLNSVLDSAFGDLVADRITHIGLSGDSTTVTASTTTLGSPNSIKVTANTSRTNQTVSTDQTWTQADVAFSIRKIGLLTGSAATDVVNIIGGDGGSAPYNEPFTIDLTSIATWTLTMGIDTTATAT